jgi:prefoldin alpha subunit
MQQPKENSKKQELYAELKELDTEIKNLNSQVEKVDDQLQDLNSSKLAVVKFMELSNGDEMRVPLTTGVYVKASLLDVTKIMINVGANIAVEKEPMEVAVILDGQIEELIEYRQTMVSEMKQLIARIEAIQSQFE